MSHTELNAAVEANQNVIALNVAMHNGVRSSVQVVKSLQHLVWETRKINH